MAEKAPEEPSLFTKEESRNSMPIENRDYALDIIDKNVFLDLIEQEKQILRKIRLRMHTKENDSRKGVTQKIIRYYEILLSYYKDDLKIWLAYIDFLMKTGLPSLVSKSLSSMLQTHTEKKLWHLAAKWELDEYNDFNNALRYLYLGLYHHSKESSLYTEVIKLELKYVYVESSQSLMEKQNSCVEKILRVYETILSELNDDLDLHMTLLKEATEYDFTSALQVIILQHLLNNFASSDVVWFNLAQRELDGHHLTTDGKYEFIKKTCVEDRLKNCIDVYNRAVKIINNEIMWVNFLNTIIDLYYEYKNEPFSSFIKTTYKLTCEEAHRNNFMSEKHYIVWLECLGNDLQMIQVLEDVISTKPEIIQLWVIRLRYYISKKQTKKVEEIFDLAIKVLGEKSVQIWRLKIQYCQLHSNEKVESVFRAGLQDSEEVSMALRPQFVEWIALYKPNHLLYKEYLHLASLKPFCFELHTRMAELEAMSLKPSEENYELIHNCIKEQSNVLNQWKEYIMNEIHYGPEWRKDVYKKYLLNKVNVNS